MKNQTAFSKIGLDIDLKMTNCECGLDNPKTDITHNYEFNFVKILFSKFSINSNCTQVLTMYLKQKAHWS